MDNVLTTWLEQATQSRIAVALALVKLEAGMKLRERSYPHLVAKQQGKIDLMRSTQRYFDELSFAIMRRIDANLVGDQSAFQQEILDELAANGVTIGGIAAEDIESEMHADEEAAVEETPQDQLSKPNAVPKPSRRKK